MPPSTTSYSPDINVWVALTYEGHVHRGIAAAWFDTLPSEATLAACVSRRQIGGKRLAVFIYGLARTGQRR
jgi:hypothetical protein